MPTSYTPILKLALPTTGELSGTWGEVVNSNITSMVEQAVAGLATINTWTTNSHTLTTANGTTSESRCAMLVIDDDGAGNPSAAATVICPTATKSYIVRNLCGQTVTVKTAAGTGVAVPNNQAALVFCDGTNVVTGAFNGDVVGPATSTNNAIVTFDGTTGKLIKDNSGATISAGVITATGFSGPLNGSVGATTPSTVVATQVDITAQGDLRLQDTTGGEYVALQAPGTLASSYTLTLPVDDGTAGQALITDGSGALSWSSAASGDVYGPASATDNAVARYDGTTGKIIQNSAVTIADDGATVIAANSTTDGLRITQTGTGNALLVEDSANPDATPTLIDNIGRIIVGHTSPVTGAQSQSPYIQIFSTVTNGVGGGVFGSYNYRADTSGGGLTFNKSRATTPGTNGIVSSGDNLGVLRFAGDDGATFLQGAVIQADVDGTPGTNDMPGRLVFSTTADGASSPTERMRIDNAGRVGIGATAGVGYNFVVGKSITGSTGSYSVIANGTVQSDVTGGANIFTSAISTQETAFTLSNVRHFWALNPVVGAGSTISNQYGFLADGGLTGATNNYGFYSNIASGTGRWNFYAAGTAANVFTGTTHIGGTVGAESLRVTPVASAVNYLVAQGQITTGGPSLLAAGSDTNIDLLLKTKGTGSINAYTSGSNLQFVVAHTASAVNYLQVTGNSAGGPPSLSAVGSDTNINTYFGTKGSGTHLFANGSGQVQFTIASTASAVNYLQVTGDSSVYPKLSAQGSGTNVAMVYVTKGTEAHIFQTNGGTNQLLIANTASAVNYLQANGGATSNAATLSAQGSDTDISIALTPKGTGGVGIGTASPTAKLDVAGSIALTGTGNRITGDFSNAVTLANRVALQTSVSGGNTIVGALPNGAGNVGGFNAYNNSDPTNASFAQIALQGADARITSGIHGTGTYLPMTFFTGGSERVRVDTSGNVGIGTASPTGRIEAAAPTNCTIKSTGLSGYGAFHAISSGTNISYMFFGNAGGEKGRISSENDGALVFSNTTSATERMRIDSSGNLLVGTTDASTPTSAAGARILASGKAQLTAINNTSLDCVLLGSVGAMVAFNYGASNVGTITTSGSSVAYNTTSDYRLKENVAPMQNALATVAQLKPVTYTWKSDGSDGQGFIAHELQAVVPDCVSGEKDAVNADGSIKPQGIDVSFLVATLTAAIQEQQEIITNLTTRLTALEAK